jgi:hypothetical protein
MKEWDKKLKTDRERKFRLRLDRWTHAHALKQGVGNVLWRNKRRAGLAVAKLLPDMNVKLSKFWKSSKGSASDALEKDHANADNHATTWHRSNQSGFTQPKPKKLTKLFNVETITVAAHKDGQFWVPERKARRIETPAFKYAGIKPTTLDHQPKHEFDIRHYPRRQSKLNLRQSHDKYKLVAKVYLMAANIFFELVGLFVMCVGTDLLFSLGNVTSSVLARIYGRELGLMMFCVGVIMQLLTICGYLGAKRESRRLLQFYVVASFVCWCVQIGIVLISYKAATDYGHYPRADTAIRNEWASLSAAQRADTQNTFGCCGWSTIHDLAEHPCPEEAVVDPFNPRTCQPILMETAAGVMKPMWFIGVTVLSIEMVTLLLAQWIIHRKCVEEQEKLYKKDVPKHVVLVRWLLAELSRLFIVGSILLFLVGWDLVRGNGFVATGTISTLFGRELGAFLITGSVLVIIVSLIGRKGAHQHDSKLLLLFSFLTVSLVLAEVLMAAAAMKTKKDLNEYSELDDRLQRAYMDLAPGEKKQIHSELQCCGYSSVPIEPSSPCPDRVDIPCKLLLEQKGTILLSGLYSLMNFIISGQMFLLIFAGVLIYQPNHFSDTNAVYTEIETRTDPYMQGKTGKRTRSLMAAFVVINYSFMLIGCGMVLVGIDLFYALGFLTRQEIAEIAGDFMGLAILVMGVFTSLFSLLGIYGGVTRKKGPLLSYLTVMSITFVIFLLTAAIALRSSQDKDTYATVSDYGLEAWKLLPDPKKDAAQRAFTCCGYTAVPTMLNTSTSFTYPFRKAVHKLVTVSRYQNRTVIKQVRFTIGLFALIHVLAVACTRSKILMAS